MAAMINERVNRLFALSLLDVNVTKFYQQCLAMVHCHLLRKAVENVPQFAALNFHDKYQVWIKLAVLVEENAVHFGKQWPAFHEQALYFQEMERQAKEHQQRQLQFDPNDYELHPFDF